MLTIQLMNREAVADLELPSLTDLRRLNRPGLIVTIAPTPSKYF
jgi:hypothetical protein